MLIIALGLAVIGLAALVFAVVTGSEVIAWVCIGASVLGVVLLIVDALRERQRHEVGAATKESGPAAGEDSDGGKVDTEYQADAFDEGDEADEASAPADSDADESVSHNAR